MNAQIILDQIIFQLTPTRTRCELFAVAGDLTEKLTSGLLKPFLAHLQTAEEQLAKGGYSIKLQPPYHRKAYWFTKGTAERFVRFVSSPEVIERVNTIETELVQLEETIRMQTLTSARVEDEIAADSSPISIAGEKTFLSSEKPRLLKKMRQDSIDSNDSGVSRNSNSKKQLLQALDTRRLVLQKEQGMAFARAAAAGYELVQLLQLIVFSDCFGAARLREACFNFVALCRKRQITGFCVGDKEWLDQDLTWALSNTTCVSILNSMKEVSPFERKREGGSDVLVRAIEPGLHDDGKLHSGREGPEISGVAKGYQPKQPSVHPNLSPSSPVCEWSNSTDLYQGWPAMYTMRNNPYATFHSYQYGFSPGSQESLTTFPGMSPIDATGLYQHPMDVLSQPLSKTPESLQMSSSQEGKLFPSLRKLQVGHRGVQNRDRRLGKDFKSEESMVHGYEKDSSELTDSSFEKSDSFRAAPLVLQEDPASYAVVRESSRQGLVDSADSNFDLHWKQRSARELPNLGAEKNRRESDSSDLSSGDSSIVVRQNKETTRLDRSFGLHQHINGNGVQGSKRTVISDTFSADFEQHREGSLGSKLKKRLDFQEHETQLKQQTSQQDSKALDDSFHIRSRPGDYEHRTKPMPELEVQGYQIYDMMSKQALKVNSKQVLKVNSVVSKQDPDDLLMMPRQRKRAPTSKLSDVMNIDIELLKSTRHANLPNSQKALTKTEPSQERVKKFLDQYNEKREAKFRGEVSSSKRAEREGKLKAMQVDLESRKSEMGRARKPERTALQTEAQFRADKSRLYKADLQKIKKEKEDEERRRLEELKAQRQERIAARRNSNLSTAQCQLSSKLPASKPKPGSIGRLLPLQKSRTSLPNSQAASSSRQRTVRSQEFSSKETPPRSLRAASASGPVTGHSQELNSKGTPVRSLRNLSKPAISQVVRSTAPPVHKQMKASIGSQPSVKTESFKAPQSTKSSASVRGSGTLSVFSGGRDYQRSRTSSLRKSEPAPIASKDPSTRRSLPGLRGQPTTAGKGMPKSLDGMKQDGKTFLKKGSGVGSSGRSVQRPKLESPGKVRALDRKPLYSVSSNMNGLKTSRRDSKEAKVFDGRDKVLTSRTFAKKTSSSTSPGLMRVNHLARAEIKDVKLSKSKLKEADEAQSCVGLVHIDLSHSMPRYSHDKGMVITPSNSNHQPMSSGVLDKYHTPSDTTMNSQLRLPADSSQQFDRSCIINGDSSSKNQSLIFNTIFPIKNLYPESIVSSGTVSRPHLEESTLYSSTLQQSNGWHRSSNSGTLEGSESGEAAREIQEAKPSKATVAAQGKWSLHK